MTHHEQLAHNPRLLFWSRAFMEVKAMTAVIVLFYLHRGVGLDQIFWLSIVWSLTALVTEIPTGYLADRIGRKRTLLLGAALLALSYAGDWFAYGFWEFVPIFVLMSASFACFSGTEEAMLYESLAELGREQEMTHRNGQLFSARSLFKMALPPVGAWIAQDLLAWQFQTLIGINALALIVGVACLLALREPQHRKEVLDTEVGIFRESLETIRREPWLLRVAFNKLLVFVAIFLAWRVYQPLLTGLGMAVVWLGVFDLLSHLIIFTGSRFLGALDRRFGASRIIFITAIVTGVSLLLAGFVQEPWLLFMLLLIAIGLGSAREPIFAHMVNEQLSSHSRATTLSNLNVLKSFVDIPIMLLGGWLAAQNLHWPLFLGVILCFIAVWVFPQHLLRRHTHSLTRMPL